MPRCGISKFCWTAYPFYVVKNRFGNMLSEKDKRGDKMDTLSADFHKYITSRMALLQSRLEEVNAMAALDKLPCGTFTPTPFLYT